MGLDYVAKCQQCGRLLGWISERLATDDPKFVATTIARYIRDGLSIERMETEAARKAAWDHSGECSKRKRKQRQVELI